MIRLFPLVLFSVVLLSGCGIDGEPLTPPAKTTQTTAVKTP